MARRPGSAAAGAQAASFPIHFGRQPTPVALPSAACSPSDCNRWCRPPPTSPTASGRPVTPSTWWGDRSATPSLPTRDHRGDGDGRDLDFTTDARPDDIEAVVAGWADAVWIQGKRFGTIGCLPGRPEVRDHHPPGRGLPARLPQARRGLRRLGRGRSGPPGLHHQRHGPPPPRARADRSLRRSGRSVRPPAAHAARPRGVLRRRPAAHAPGGPVHRQARPRAGARTGRGGPGRTSPALHRLGRADPGRAGQDRHGAGAVGRPLVRGAHRPGRRVPPRAAGPGPRTGPDPPAQGRPGPHPGRGGQDQPRPPAPPGRPVPRRRQAEDPGLRRRGGDLPPPRGGRGPHDPAPHAGPALPQRRRGRW